MNFFYILTMVIIITACKEVNKTHGPVTLQSSAIDTIKAKDIKTTKNNSTVHDTTYRIITLSNKTFGYEIIVDAHVIIRQENIPGLEGNKGFKTEYEARKVATYVLGQIKNGIFPPTLSEDHLKQLNISL